MSEKLRLGPLPKTDSVRLTIALPGQVKADLDRYSELYGAAYGEAVDAAALVPYMLKAFMERDRSFRRQRYAGAVHPPGASALIEAATSSTNAKGSEDSSSAL